MTREEAIRMMPAPRWYSEDSQRVWLLDSLTGLGVLKLDALPAYAFPPLNEDFLVNCHSYEVDRVVVTKSGSVWGRMSSGEWKALK